LGNRTTLPQPCDWQWTGSPPFGIGEVDGDVFAVLAGTALTLQ